LPLKKFLSQYEGNFFKVTFTVAVQYIEQKVIGFIYNDTNVVLELEEEGLYVQRRLLVNPLHQEIKDGEARLYFSLLMGKVAGLISFVSCQALRFITLFSRESLYYSTRCHKMHICQSIHT